MIRDLFDWQPIGPAATARLDEVLASWAGTPWIAGQACRGVGADCVRFVFAAYDDLDKKPGRVHRIPRANQDLSLHAKREAVRLGLRAVRFYPLEVNRAGPIEPGDMIVTKRGAGPSHVLLVGTSPGVAWHATEIGVCLGSLGQLGHSNIGELQRVYRHTLKANW